MEGFSYFTIKMLLRFLYTGQVIITKGNMKDFIDTANEFKIRAIKNVNMKLENTIDGPTNFVFDDEEEDIPVESNTKENVDVDLYGNECKKLDDEFIVKDKEYNELKVGKKVKESS